MKIVQNPFAVKSKYSNNGAMTRHFEQVVKKGLRGDALASFVRSLLRAWSMSSAHVIYESTLSDVTKLDADAATLVYSICVASDAEKANRSYAFCIEQGMSDSEALSMAWPDNRYGRATRAS